jgi:hypothetical protein
MMLGEIRQAETRNAELSRISLYRFFMGILAHLIDSLGDRRFTMAGTIVRMQRIPEEMSAGTLVR